MRRFLLLVAIFAVVVVGGRPVVEAQLDNVWTLRGASGDLTAADTPAALKARLISATVTIDVTKLTLADADDEVDFYVQTTYDGTNWVDCQNFHFDNADNGATALRSAVIDGMTDGPGTTKSIAGTNPAAGNEITEAVPANAVWQIDGLYASLTTDATVADRQVHVTVDDGTSTVFESVSASVQAASLTHDYSIGPHGITATVVATTHWIPLGPGLLMNAGHRILTATDLIESGDDWSAPQLVVKEWHDDAVVTDGTIRDNVRSYNRPLGTHIRVKATVTGATAPTYAYAAYVTFK